MILGKAQWIICSLDKKKIGFLNIYVPNIGANMVVYSQNIANDLPEMDLWVVGEDLNMMEYEVDCTGNLLKKLSKKEQDEWDNLVLKFGVENT